MTIVIQIDHPIHDPQGMKELIAMELEKFGDGIHVVEVAEDDKQQKLWGKKYDKT